MKYTCLLLSLFIPSLSIASPDGQWKCMAFDKQEKSYEAFGDNIQKTMHAALMRCKAESKYHDSCKTAQSFCEQASQDARCFVSDEEGRSWNANGADGCKTALTLCNEWQSLHGAESECTVKHDN